MPKFYFFSQILLSPHAEKKRHEFETNCRVFFETVFLTFCVTGKSKRPNFQNMKTNDC